MSTARVSAAQLATLASSATPHSIRVHPVAAAGAASHAVTMVHHIPATASTLPLAVQQQHQQRLFAESVLPATTIVRLGGSMGGGATGAARSVMWFATPPVDVLPPDDVPGSGPLRHSSTYMRWKVKRQQQRAKEGGGDEQHRQRARVVLRRRAQHAAAASVMASKRGLHEMSEDHAAVLLREYASTLTSADASQEQHAAPS